MSAERLTREGRLRRRIDACKKRYDETQDPKFAWCAYELSRSGNMQVPAWVPTYIKSIERWHLDWCKRGYDETQNPVFAWIAYEVSRSDGLPIPRWVLTYFDTAAENLSWLTQDPSTAPKKKQIAPAIAGAFGFVPGGVEMTDRRNIPKDLILK